MTVLTVLTVAAVVLFGAGRAYSRYLARQLGEDPSRQTPAVAHEDGRDFVPTPTPVVFAHHFASIAGAGPIVGPVLAIIYGWLPALVWVLAGGVLIGAVHDYLATYMATREGGQSMATVARRMLGKDAFVAMTIFLIVMLALVCATFLNLSAVALTSMLPFERLELPPDQTLFRVVGDRVVIGGIASMSVIVITAVAPLLGWLYLKKKVAVWKCSLLAVAICAVSIAIGVYRPVVFGQTEFLGWTFSGQEIWMLLLSAYVLVAAGVPVWIFLQSRDFVNVHILYVGMGALLVTLLVAGLRGDGGSAESIPAINIAEGTEAMGMFWPGMFIVIACGAVSGFHSLCAGGTTCKQLNSERAARQIGYNGMLLESFLAACVIAVLMIGAVKGNYIRDVHPRLLGPVGSSNAVLGFAMAVGNAGKIAFGIPIAVGALAGMVLLEGFLVTTLDTAIRLTRYLIEEVWRTFFGQYDVFALPVGMDTARSWGTGDTPVGADGIPPVPDQTAEEPAPFAPKITSGAFRWTLLLLRKYWFNSGLAVLITLVFAFSGGAKALWGIFATSNQLLAALVLSLGALWLLRQGRRVWFALLPGLFMLVTTLTNLVLLFEHYRHDLGTNGVLFLADIVLLLITVYLLAGGVRAAWAWRRERPIAVTGATGRAG
ncbi:MAG: carbon starvation protein A [Phycisphaerae bacterium]|mgnify:CR=1 FL=1|nr:carbon starvation protein A [Phycisphaerae bacterium]